MQYLIAMESTKTKNTKLGILFGRPRKLMENYQIFDLLQSQLVFYKFSPKLFTVEHVGRKHSSNFWY
jgi:hypothetical protein